MKRIWSDEEVTRILKQAKEIPIPPASFEHLWLKITDKLEKRKNHFWKHLVWKPWSHPVRWVMATGFLCVLYTGVGYHQNQINQRDQEDIGSYLLSVANPTDNVPNDLRIENVSILLSESSLSVPDVQVDSHLEPIDADQILL